VNEHDIVDVNGFPAVVIGGIPRILNKLSPDPVKRAAFPPFFGDTLPSVDPSLWEEIDRRTDFGDQFILDQQNHGSCVGFSSAGALMRALVLGGHEFVKLSGAYTYSWINGGSDDGAQISDSLTSLQQHGTCLDSTVGWDSIYRNQTSKGDTEAQRFKILEAYKVANFAELMSGLQNDFIGVVAVMVGNTFTRLDSQGVCGYDRGPGNHAVCIDGAHKLPNGAWSVDMPNSWGLSFGINGRGRLTQQHIEGVEQDAYIIRAARVDPQSNPPVVK
jgi:hypothetical protein